MHRDSVLIRITVAALGAAVALSFPLLYPARVPLAVLGGAAFLGGFFGARQPPSENGPAPLPAFRAAVAVFLCVLASFASFGEPSTGCFAGLIVAAVAGRTFKVAQSHGFNSTSRLGLLALYGEVLGLAWSTLMFTVIEDLHHGQEDFPYMAGRLWPFSRLISDAELMETLDLGTAVVPAGAVGMIAGIALVLVERNRTTATATAEHSNNREWNPAALFALGLPIVVVLVLGGLLASVLLGEAR